MKAVTAEQKVVDGFPFWAHEVYSFNLQHFC